MNKSLAAMLAVLLTAALACGASAQPTMPAPPPTLAHSVFDDGRTAYGFFPSPPEFTLESLTATIQGISRHGDILLVQRSIPWGDFQKSPDAGSQDIVDLRNLLTLAHQSDLDAVFVVDPLNGLNRREFQGLPFGWPASFANPDVRASFTNYTLRILREFHPRYLGLASEINTYADFHPEDFPNYLSLYREVYAKIKAESPQTRVFVTFQWEELNNLIAGTPGNGRPYATRWDQVETFEPQLDLWAISSYPFIVFRSGREIPSDYYSPLVGRTTKPLAVAEGGYTSQPVGAAQGTPADQVMYLNAIHTQLGRRLAFWIYLLYSDFNLDSYTKLMNARGQQADVNTLGMFASVGLAGTDGSPKPGLEVWDGFQR